MNEYPEDDYTPKAAEPEPDPRIVAMHQVVELERQHEQATRECVRRQKMQAIVQNELREARDRLAGLLGYPSNANKPRPMDSATAGTISKSYR